MPSTVATDAVTGTPVLHNMWYRDARNVHMLCTICPTPATLLTHRPRGLWGRDVPVPPGPIPILAVSTYCRLMGDCKDL